MDRQTSLANISSTQDSTGVENKQDFGGQRCFRLGWWAGVGGKWVLWWQGWDEAGLMKGLTNFRLRDLALRLQQTGTMRRFLRRNDSIHKEGSRAQYKILTSKMIWNVRTSKEERASGIAEVQILCGELQAPSHHGHQRPSWTSRQSQVITHQGKALLPFLASFHQIFIKCLPYRRQ